MMNQKNVKVKSTNAPLLYQSAAHCIMMVRTHKLTILLQASFDIPSFNIQHFLVCFIRQLEQRDSLHCTVDSSQILQGYAHGTYLYPFNILVLMFCSF